MGWFCEEMGQHATARERGTKSWEAFMRGWKAREHSCVHLCLEDQLPTGKEGNTSHPFGPLPFSELGTT